MRVYIRRPCSHYSRAAHKFLKRFSCNLPTLAPESHRAQVVPGDEDIQRVRPLAIDVLKARGRPHRSPAVLAAVLGTGPGASADFAAFVSQVSSACGGRGNCCAHTNFRHAFDGSQKQRSPRKRMPRHIAPFGHCRDANSTDSDSRWHAQYAATLSLPPSPPLSFGQAAQDHLGAVRFLLRAKGKRRLQEEMRIEKQRAADLNTARIFAHSMGQERRKPGRGRFARPLLRAGRVPRGPADSVRRSLSIG